MEDIFNIAGRIHSTSQEEVVTTTNEILDAAQEKKQSEVNQEVGERLDFDNTRINALSGGNYVTVQATQSTTAADIPTLINASGEGEQADTLYRVGFWDGSAYVADKYTEYAWNGTAYVILDVNSSIGEVFDISQYNAVGGTPATYADLTAALSGTNVPTSVQRGGMSIKFIKGTAQSSDNKYVQYRLMADEWSTTVADWQGVDDRIVAGTKNIAESNGVDIFVAEMSKGVFEQIVNFPSGQYLQVHATNMIPKGSVIVSITGAGTSATGRSTSNVEQETGLTLQEGVIVTKDINYVRALGYNGTITIKYMTPIYKSLIDFRDCFCGTQISQTIDNYVNTKLIKPILKGSYIKSVKRSGVEAEIFIRTTEDTSEEAQMIISDTIVTKDANYIRGASGDYVIEIGSSAEYTQTKEKQITSGTTFNVTFDYNYQYKQLDIELLKGLFVKSVAINGIETYLNARTNLDDSETPLIFKRGVILTKDIRYLKNLTTQGVCNIEIGTYADYIDYVKPQNETPLASSASIVEMQDGYSVVLTDYPQSARKGDNISFNSKVTSFNKLLIGKGCENSYVNCWFEITTTNVTLNYVSDDGLISDSVAHNLIIDKMLNINIAYNGTVKFIMQTLSGNFSHDFTINNSAKYYNVKGIIKAVSDGSVLTAVKLCATNIDFKRPIWIFGASYTNVDDRQMIGALKNLGYFDYYLHGYAGSPSTAAFNDGLVKAINFGIPKILVWAIMSNDGSTEVWQEYAQKVINLCSVYNIELVFVNYADMKNKEFSDRRQFVINSGKRYIDLVAAVQESPYSEGTDCWYNGMMSGDGIHPTVKGANAMAMEVLKDLPEIMG